MNIAAETIQRLMVALRFVERYQRPLIDLLNEIPSKRRFPSIVQVSTGVTTSAPVARNGNIVTGCTVKLTKLKPANPQTNPPTWTITDQGKADVWAIQLSATAGATAREVILIGILGLWIIVAYDCTAAGSGGTAPTPAQDASTTTQTNQNVTTQNGQSVMTQ